MSLRRSLAALTTPVLLLCAVLVSSGPSPSLALSSQSASARAEALWTEPHTAAAYALVKGPSSARIVQLDEHSKAALTASLERLETPSSHIISASWSQPLTEPLGTSSTPSDPRFSAQWALQALDLPAVWPSHDGSGQLIALADSGFSSSAELPSVTLGRNWVFDAGHPSISDTSDGAGHGTATATMAAAAADGTGMVGAAPGATVLPLRVLGNSGSGNSSDLASAIIYAADYNIRVLSMSVGVMGADATLSAAIAYAATRGVLMVAAAGNGGAAASPPLPASDDNTIAVAATDSSSNPASFSQTGSYIDLAAPGVAVTGLSYDGSYYAWSGTSMSTPLVAGMAAILFEAHPEATTAQVRQALITSATDVYTPGVDTRTGSGIPQATAALAVLASLLAGPTTTTPTTTSPSTSSPGTTEPSPTSTTTTTTTTTTVVPTTSAPVTNPPPSAPSVTITLPPEPPTTPAPPPAAPANLKLSVYGSDVLLSWSSVSGVSRYVVTRDGAVLTRTAGTISTDRYRALVQGVYSYAVYSETESGELSLPAYQAIAVEKLSAPRLDAVSVSKRTLTLRVTLPRVRPKDAVLYVYIDGRVALRVTPSSRVRLTVPRGTHSVKLQLVSPRGASAPSKTRSVRVR